MDRAAQHTIFQAQTANVRSLLSVQKRMNRQANHALRRGNAADLDMYTKLMALLFCAWSEANLSKLIHTPYGFELSEIADIKSAWRLNIEAAWLKTIELGLAKVATPPPNASNQLHSLVKDFVVEPAGIRNKVAHGQWSVALNKRGSSLNPDLTSKLAELSIVDIQIWFRSSSLLSEVVEALIESPESAFHRDFATKLSDLEAFRLRSAAFTVSSKIQKLKPLLPRA
jgi:hypothetical protein